MTRRPYIATWISAAMLVAAFGWALGAQSSPGLNGGQLATATSDSTPLPVYLPFMRRDASATPLPTRTPTRTPLPTDTARPATPTNTARPPTAEPTSRPCCKCCTRGVSKPCGDTCISASRTCHTPPGCACFCSYDPLLGEEICEPPSAGSP